MKIILEPNKTLEAIQEEFISYFPFLNLAFFHSEYKANEGYTNKVKLDLNLSLIEVNLLIENSTLTFEETMKVSEFEKAFFDLTTIAIQVLRKTKNSWIQTIASDHWSLGEQQMEAEALLKEPNKEEPLDYHDQE
jgi:hypothetical protein